MDLATGVRALTIPSSAGVARQVTLFNCARRPMLRSSRRSFHQNASRSGLPFVYIAQHRPVDTPAPMNAVPPSSTTHRPVPDDVRGVWRRTLLQTGTDADQPPQEDDSSWVRWMQTSLWHADLRVPQSALEGREALPLGQLSPVQLAALAAQQGFAGITQLDNLPEGQICNWLRRTDYQPPALQPDAGWLVFDRPDRLIEIGVHDSYNEIWERLPDSVGRFLALAELAQGGRDTGARILVAGDYMMAVRPRAARWPRGMNPGYTLTDVLLHSPDQALDWLACEVSFGRFGQGQWVIERSTLPEREGQVLGWGVQRVDEHHAQVQQGAAATAWQILEWSCDTDQLGA